MDLKARYIYTSRKKMLILTYKFLSNLYGLSSYILISSRVFFKMTMQFCPKVMVEMRRRVWREILSDSFASCFSRLSAASLFICMYV